MRRASDLFTKKLVRLEAEEPFVEGVAIGANSIIVPNDLEPSIFMMGASRQEPLRKGNGRVKGSSPPKKVTKNYWVLKKLKRRLRPKSFNCPTCKRIQEVSLSKN